MKKKIILTLLFLFAFSLNSVSFAFWLWTPKENKFVNPKYAVKDSPQEQYDWAMKFYKEGDFKRAADEFVRLTSSYKDSDLAPEAQYYAARSFEEQGKYYFAFQNYQKTIDNYPYTKRMDEIIQKEYDIANIFKNKEEPKLIDLELSLSLERAIEIYKKIVDNSPFGPYADKSLFEMASCYRRAKKYSEAIDTYEKIINDYPSSSFNNEAKYEVAYTMYEASKDPEYDQESTQGALEKFERISKNTAIPSVAEEADKMLESLKSKKAMSDLKIAEFYERQKKYKSAIVYYKDVKARYPNTTAAEIAELKIQKLKEKVKE